MDNSLEDATQSSREGCSGNFTMSRIILVLLTTILCCCNSYKILGLYHIPTGSHRILATRLFTEIAKRGHDVTFTTPYVSKTPVKNLTEVPIESLQGVLRGVITSHQWDDATPLAMAKFITDVQYQLTEHLLSSEQVQKLLKSNEKYDAVIVYQYLNDATQAICHHFKAPCILFSSMPMYVPESFLLSHPMPSSYVPNILTPYTGRMNFWQRLRNSYYDAVIILYYVWNILPKYQEMTYKYIPGHLDVYSFLNNASLVLINSHVSTNEATPLVPNAIEIGGYHIEEPKPLPDDLQKFLDNSKNGVILFSMGSIARSADFPEEKRNALLKSFAKLKQNVLWKWEDENLPGIPKNVKIMKWIPQSDVLAHPNVKAFISHGGLLSTMESVYFAKPIIGIPLMVDQKMNIALAASYGYALHLPFKEITEEKVTWAIDEILNNPKYRDSIRQRSNIMRDRPMRPVDTALYWIEYVIRHRGAQHLRYPGMDLTWYQRYLLDVVAFVIFVTVIPIIAIISILRRLFPKPSEIVKKKKKNN